MLTSTRMPAWVETGSKFLVSAFLLLFLIRGFDWNQLQNILRHADLLLICAAVLVLAASPAASVPRWSAILRQLNHPLPVAMLARWLYVGAFFSQMLPSTVGGDLWRIWACRRAGVPLATATHSVLLERLAGVLVIVMFLAATSPWLIARMDIDPSRMVPWLALALGLAVVCGVAIATARWRRPVVLPEPLRGLGRAGLAVARSRPTLLLMLITAIAGQLVAVLAMYLLARGIGAPLSFADCVITLAPALLIAMVPISLGGWGVRESAFVVILHLYDVSREQALTLSILFGLALMGASLIGLALWLWQPAASRRLPLRAEALIEHGAERTSRY